MKFSYLIKDFPEGICCSLTTKCLESYPARALVLLLADSAPTVHSGEGEDFLMGQLDFFTKTAVTPKQKMGC